MIGQLGAPKLIGGARLHAIGVRVKPDVEVGPASISTPESDGR
jgi:hypothetical protein